MSQTQLFYKINQSLRAVCLVLLLIGVVKTTHAQEAKLFSNGEIYHNSSKKYDGVMVKSRDEDECYFFTKDDHITQSYFVKDLLKKNGSSFKINLKPIQKLDNTDKSKKIKFVFFHDETNKLSGTSHIVPYVGYMYDPTVAKEEFIDEINDQLEEFDYDCTNKANNSDEETPDYIITGNVEYYRKETKGTSGFIISIRIKWTVYNVQNESEEFSKVTSGFSNSGIAATESLELKKALKNASLGLITDEEFLTAVSSEVHTKDESFEGLKLIKDTTSKELSYGKVIANSIQSVVTVKTELGHGSGFLITKDGYVITNYHVIRFATEFSVIFDNGIEVPCEIVSKDGDMDLALLRIKGKGFVPLALDNSGKSTDIGATVVAIGTPANLQLGQTVTKGIVSGHRIFDDKNYIQTDVSINSGNSGGALLNLKGQVIGIIVAKVKGDSVEGLGFAIPVADAIETFKLSY